MAVSKNSKKNADNAFLVEIAWEVCNQVGGIYTVIRSKVPSMIEKWGDNYLLVGPYYHGKAMSEFEPIEDYSTPAGKVVQALRSRGIEAHYGYWLVTGKPKVVLINPYSLYHNLGIIKFDFWQYHDISSPDQDDLFNQVMSFGDAVKQFIKELVHFNDSNKRIITHFHEWMVGPPIPELRRENVPVSIVFTTHATLLGRYIAMNNSMFYDHLPYFNWVNEAKHYNIDHMARMERAAANGAHIFTTVSEVTARECIALLGRKPDVITPNGLNIERFIAGHEHQNLHGEYKQRINNFVKGHFFQSYSFDLDKTVYFFTSGRFEYTNKGYDLTLEALARLNWRMKEENIDTNVVMFFITKQPYHSINPLVLQNRALMEEIKDNTESIGEVIKKRLFEAAVSGNSFTLPDLSSFVDEYWRMRLRRTLQSWKSHQLPMVVTHNLVNDQHDEILNFLRRADLINHPHDKVKIVYHPDFISVTNPLFGMDYGQFVRGCHLGIFPSYYEPWGYTPLECIASGVPTITSDLAGFGDYVLNTINEEKREGISIVNRRNQSFHDAANQMTEFMLDFVKLNRRERIVQRNKVESSSENFDWKKLTAYYDVAYSQALKSTSK